MTGPTCHKPAQASLYRAVGAVSVMADTIPGNVSDDRERTAMAQRKRWSDYRKLITSL